MGLEQLLPVIISSLGPGAALGWIIAAVLARKLWVVLREEKATEKSLREQLMELQKLHQDSILAERDGRISDLKQINSDYNKALGAITKVLDSWERS